MYEYDTTRKHQRVQLSDKSKFLGTTFGYMFIALAITGIIATLCGYLFSFVTNPNIYYIVMGVSYFGLFGMMLWIQLSLFRGKHSLWAPYILYSALMGVVLSTFTMFLEFYTIAIAVGIAALVFGIMALIGIFAKRNLSIFWTVGSCMMFGAIGILSFNLLMFFFLPEMYSLTNVLVSCIMFAAMMCITIFDIWRITQIAESGVDNNNVCLYCAFNLYTDFIYILIRIIQMVAIARRDN